MTCSACQMANGVSTRPVHHTGSQWIGIVVVDRHAQPTRTLHVHLSMMEGRFVVKHVHRASDGKKR